VKRVTAVLTALAGLGGMLCLANSAAGQAPVAGAAGAPAASSPRSTVAVFNMAAVMKDYDKVKYHLYKLNKLKHERSANLIALRGELIRLESVIRTATDQPSKEKLSEEFKVKQRKYQDEDSAVNKVLNEEASKMISSLYDEIKMVVDKTAEMNSYDIVFAYPDAVSPTDMANPSFKELKLKPPAAQPFYVSKKVDITSVVIVTLNKWYPPKDEQGRPVDMKSLPQLETPATGAPTTGGPGAPAAPMVPTGVPMSGVRPAGR
jgi:Skp family chaperone for outer membrane proteins